ncbi:MAG: acyl-CoA/acyl-ACP dehydrogenase [Gemmatimonadetes bacterium]|nr:acyl-CoA/acyl-ACP dehydrogenase [Gemmatimonadota bacterium]
MLVEREDTRVMLAEVGRFAQERIAAAAARPETPIAPSVLEQLTHEAAELGIIHTAAGENGFSIWEHSENAESMAFNIGALTHLGRANPGVAFSWHRLTLARAVAGSLGLTVPFGTTLVSTGHYGLAQTSAARWLKAGALGADDLALLSDWLDRTTHTTTLTAHASWPALLWPVWREGRMAWQYARRDQLEITACRPQHGLDELSAFQLRDASSVADVTTIDEAASRRLWSRALTMDFIGLLAIAAGALARGQQLATDFAGIRRQGGKIIAGHAAVQQMLSDIEVARHGADLALSSFARPLDDIDLGGVVATRISAHAQLCDAANQVMQVHGGIGYMRDAGPEKLVRDQHMLKLQSGGTRDASLFLAGWMGGDA